MADLCSLSATGRLTKDAVRKTLPTGTNLVEFDLAINQGWGNYKSTTYLTCNLWGKMGDTIHQYLIKGKTVAVTGPIKMSEWTSSIDGQKHQKLILDCKDCLLMADGKGNVVDAPPTGEVFNPANAEDAEVTF